MYLESMGYVSFGIERIDELIQGSKEKHILEYGLSSPDISAIHMVASIRSMVVLVPILT